MNKRLVIFDLDGTLLNTIGDLAAATNAVMRAHGYPEHDLTAYRRFVGNGVSKLIERALPAELRDPAHIKTLLQEFLVHYQAHIDEQTEPYDGIPELLAELTARKIATAVASNKFHAGTVRLIARFFPEIPFIAVLGQREGIPIKPDPTVVQEILRKADLSTEAVLYVGDSGVDMQTARNAAVESVGVTWGFRSREELLENGACHLVSHPAEIVSLL